MNLKELPNYLTDLRRLSDVYGIPLNTTINLELDVNLDGRLKPDDPFLLQKAELSGREAGREEARKKLEALSEERRRPIWELHQILINFSHLLETEPKDPHVPQWRACLMLICSMFSGEVHSGFYTYPDEDRFPADAKLIELSRKVAEHEVSALAFTPEA